MRAETTDTTQRLDPAVVYEQELLEHGPEKGLVLTFQRLMLQREPATDWYRWMQLAEMQVMARAALAERQQAVLIGEVRDLLCWIKAYLQADDAAAPVQPPQDVVKALVERLNVSPWLTIRDHRSGPEIDLLTFQQVSFETGSLVFTNSTGIAVYLDSEELRSLASFEDQGFWFNNEWHEFAPEASPRPTPQPETA